MSRRNSIHADVSIRIIPSERRLVQVGVPARAPHPAGMVEVERLGGEGVERELHRLPLGRQAVPLHHDGAGGIIDVDVGACHTPTIHQEGIRRQASGQPDPAGATLVAWAGVTLRAVATSGGRARRAVVGSGP